MNKKPDTFTRRFIEWSKFHGCPVMIENKDGDWEPFIGNKFNWNAHNYKIDNKKHEEYYSRLYAHGIN